MFVISNIWWNIIEYALNYSNICIWLRKINYRLENDLLGIGGGGTWISAATKEEIITKIIRQRSKYDFE